MVIMLLGNKCDQTAEKVIRREDGERLARVRSDGELQVFVKDFK